MEYRYNTQGSINKTAFPKTIIIIKSVIINLSRTVFNEDNPFNHCLAGCNNQLRHRYRSNSSEVNNIKYPSDV